MTQQRRNGDEEFLLFLIVKLVLSFVTLMCCLVRGRLRSFEGDGSASDNQPNNDGENGAVKASIFVAMSMEVQLHKFCSEEEEEEDFSLNWVLYPAVKSTFDNDDCRRLTGPEAGGHAPGSMSPPTSGAFGTEPHMRVLYRFKQSF